MQPFAEWGAGGGGTQDIKLLSAGAWLGAVPSRVDPEA